MNSSLFEWNQKTNILRHQIPYKTKIYTFPQTLNTKAPHQCNLPIIVMQVEKEYQNTKVFQGYVFVCFGRSATASSQCKR